MQQKIINELNNQVADLESALQAVETALAEKASRL